MALKITLREDSDGLQIPFSKLKRILTKNIQNIESDVSYFIGAGHVLLRETFIKVGGYDTDLFYGLEELDISSEIIKENKKIIYYPEVEIIHEPKESLFTKYASSSRNTITDPSEASTNLFLAPATPEGLFDRSHLIGWSLNLSSNCSLILISDESSKTTILALID